MSADYEDTPPHHGHRNGGGHPAPEYGTEAFYWQHAVKLYPDAEYKDTEFFREMIKIAAWLEQTQDPVLALPDKKLRIAHMTAAKLGVLARVTTAPGRPAAAVPKPALPPANLDPQGLQVNPPELLALIEEEKAAAGGRVATLLIEAVRMVAGRIHNESGNVYMDETGDQQGDDLLDDFGEWVVKKRRAGLCGPGRTNAGDNRRCRNMPLLNTTAKP